MNYDMLIGHIADDLDITRPRVRVVVDKLIEVMIAAFIDSDNVELKPLGALSFQYIPPSSSESGEENYTGRVKFSVSKEVVKFIIQKNIEMIEREEQE